MGRTVVFLLVSFLLGGAVVGLWMKDRDSSTAPQGAGAEERDDKGRDDAPAKRSERSPKSAQEAYGAPAGGGGTAPSSRPAAGGTSASTPKPGDSSGALTRRSGAFMGREGWRGQPPANSMRLAQFVLPRAGDDGDDGEVVIFHFPQAGGGTERNLTRWIGMFEGAEGKGSEPAVTREQTTSSGFVIHTVDVVGHYVAAVMPGAEETHDKPDWRLIGAVIEAEGGSYFVKSTGPAATMNHWGPSVQDFFADVAAVLKVNDIKPR